MTTGGHGSARAGDLDALVDRVHRRLIETDPGGAHRPAAVRALVADVAPLLGSAARETVTARVLARVDGLGPVEPLLADPAVSEIMINGPGPVWIERGGEVVPTDLVLTRDEIDLLVERMMAPLGRRVDRRMPWVDGRLADGSRVNVVVPPVALDGPCVTIRRFVLRRVELGAFAAPGVAGLVTASVRAGMNVLVSGGTGAGKTTLLNAIAAVAPADARFVSVEDSAELALPHPHVVRLEARPASAEGVGEVTIRDLVRNALRMRPDRLVVGEVRGPEALDLVQALNTGHAGCLSTVHANGPLDALRRIESLALMAGEGLPLTALRAQVAGAIDLVVQVARRPDGSRRITEVAEVSGPDEVRLLSRHDEVTAAPTRPARLAPVDEGSGWAGVGVS